MIGGTGQLLGISSSLAILLTLAGVVLLVAGASAIFMSRRRPPGVPDIPPAMQPGPSDTDLEKPLLEKLQGWGLLLVVFFVIWMPVVWLLEPSANVDDENELRQTSIERGENAIELFSEENPGGVGCVQCHGPGLSGGQNRFQGNVVPVPALVNVCARLTLEQIQTTIEQGREGTDMPSWSIKFRGALNDQQIAEIVDYIVELNRDNVPLEQNKCLNPLAGTTPTASPTASPTP